VLGEHALNLLDLSFAPDEAGELQGQVVGGVRGFALSREGYHPPLFIFIPGVAGHTGGVRHGDLASGAALLRHDRDRRRWLYGPVKDPARVPSPPYCNDCVLRPVASAAEESV
jgi:hypothetical protein